MSSISGLSDVVSPPSNHHHHHVVLFPFMSKGHTIPLLELARLLLNRRLYVTLFTTPASRPFIGHSLAAAGAGADDTSSAAAVAVVDLPFPENLPGIPAGVESTDGLPSMSLFYSFAMATELMQPDFERALESLHPPATFIVSDAFLWWTLHSASKLGVPRFVSYGMSTYAMVLNRASIRYRLFDGVLSANEFVPVPHFPSIKIKRNDFEILFSEPQTNPLASEFYTKVTEATSRSFGMIVNSFHGIEQSFAEYFSREYKPKPWCVGPLCLAEQPIQTQPEEQSKKRPWIQWLDQKRDHSVPVLYVAFGSQAELSSEQIREIATGLEESGLYFLWVVRKKADLPNGFEESVKNRGMVVREWVDQREILNHKSVKGFLSHCGWNSVMESVSAGVPILALPIMADQPLNAKMVAEEIKVGLRVETCDGSVKGMVNRERLKMMVRELMEGEKGKEVRNKVKEVADMARKAMEEGGSSWKALDSLVDEASKAVLPRSVRES